jgi:uncharacterized protein YbaA (DUF1428 family)
MAAERRIFSPGMSEREVAGRPQTIKLEKGETEMGIYVDGFIVPLKKDKLEKYREIATTAGKVWREHGALDYVECIADDVKPGKLTSFPQSVQLQDDEVVVFAWIVYASRAERDRINAAVMADPRLKCDPDDMPFDGQRMIFGGFEEFVRT